jgi:N-acetyl-anhydromuramyl-L-alanine amidase AmpD
MQRKTKYIVGAALAFFLLTSSGKPTIIDIVDDLPKHPTKRYGTRPISAINKYIIHHSASTTHTAEDFARYHVNSRDWPSIGYHFAIEKDGTIKQTNRLNTLSYHTSGENTTGVGIVLSGNFNIEQPTPAQIKSLKQLLNLLKKEVGNYPVYGHRDFAATSCPGDNLYYYIDHNLL